MGRTIIETGRLRLRTPVAADLEPLRALGADAEVMRFIGSGAAQSAEEAEQWLEQLLAAADERAAAAAELPGWLVISIKAGGDWAGLAALKQLARQHAAAIGIEPAVEVGYRLAHGFWGRGYATEAARALLRHGFEALELPLITAIADARNEASNRVLEKAGLVYRRSYELEGRTIKFHSLSRPEFRQAQPPQRAS